MFEGLTKGLDQGPVGANVVLNSALQVPSVPVGYTAEPAQVMVMVQNTRAEQAETKLASLKASVGLGIIILVLLMCLVVWVYLRRRKAPEYKGTELPGAPLQDLKPLAAPAMSTMLTTHTTMPAPVAAAPALMAAPVYTDKPNIVRVHGPIPLWTPDETRDEPEPRVSESDSSIASLVKQREIFTKDLELSMAQAQTQQTQIN